MPATTTMPARSAIARTADAHDPSSGSAIGASGTPNRHMVASGNSTRPAPASAARRVYSSTRPRLAAGSVPLWICARAIRMPLRLAAARTGQERPGRLGHGTESTPSRMRRRGGSTPTPSSRSRSSIARHRTRGPNTPWPATLAHARSAAVSSVWIGWPCHVVVDQHLGQPLGEIRRAFDRERIAGQRQADRPVGVQQHPAAEPAQLVAGAVDDQPTRRQRRCIVDHASGTASAGYWRSTLNARTKTGLPPGQFETAEREFDCAVLGGARAARPVRDGFPGRRLGHRRAPPAVAPPAPASSPAARRSRGRLPAGRRRTAARRAPVANAPASGRCGAAGCSPWCLG